MFRIHTPLFSPTSKTNDTLTALTHSHKHTPQTHFSLYFLTTETFGSICSPVNFCDYSPSLSLSFSFSVVTFFSFFLSSVCVLYFRLAASAHNSSPHTHSLTQTDTLQNIFLLCSLSLSASSSPPNQLNKQKNEFCPTPSNAIAAISSNFTRAAFVCLLSSSQP